MKKFFIVIIVFALAVVGYTFTQPVEYTISKSHIIKKPVGVTFSYINDYQNWKKWSEWFKADPKTEMTYSDPSLGMGARQEWKSDITGEGYQITRDYEHNKKLSQQLVFTAPWQGGGWSYFIFESIDEGATKVTWSYQSKNQNFMEKLLYWTMIKREVGSKISESLKNMDKL